MSDGRQSVAPFAARVTAVCGAAGETWLAALPVLVERACQRWGVTVEAVYPPSYNYVLAVRQADGAPAVLKLCLPDPSPSAEGAALRHFAGRGAVRLLAEDAGDRALLLERAEPGTMLTAVEAVDDRRATAIAAGMIRALHRPAPADLPSVLRWAAAFARLRARDGGTGPLDPTLVAQAEELFPALHHSRTDTVVLHADLHHENILDGGGRGYLAIDPHGSTGDPAYETGALLRNPLDITSRHGYQRLLERRAQQLAEEAGHDLARVRGWALGQAVLSACWSLEGGETGWERAMAVAACFTR